jgi:hypothetical protein
LEGRGCDRESRQRVTRRIIRRVVIGTAARRATTRIIGRAEIYVAMIGRAGVEKVIRRVIRRIIRRVVIDVVVVRRVRVGGGC